MMMIFNFQLQIPLSSHNFELKSLCLLKGYRNVSVGECRMSCKKELHLGKDYYMSWKNCY